MRVGWLRRCPDIARKPIRKRAHTQLVRNQTATDVSARWATVDWSWHEEWNKWARANLHFKNKQKSAGREWMVEHSPKILTSQEKAAITSIKKREKKIPIPEDLHHFRMTRRGMSGSSCRNYTKRSMFRQERLRGDWTVAIRVITSSTKSKKKYLAVAS